MLTQADVLAQGYKLNPAGGIATPGKFEGEPWFILQVWDWMMDGDGEELDGATIFEVDEETRKAFDLDPDTTYLVLSTADTGFAHVEELTQEDYDQIVGDLENDCYDGEED